MEDQISQKLDLFFGNYTFIDGKKGDIFIHAEEPPAGIYYLQDGLVRQYVVSQKGEEITVNIFRKPSFFPMMWAINNSENKFYFEAITDVQMWRAPKEEVIKFLKNEPEVMYNLLARLYKGIDGLLGRMTHLMAGNARAKVVFTIVNMHDRFSNNTNEIDYETTHKDLASISGVTRETFSREIKKLEEEGRVKMDNGIITVIDLKSLADELFIS